MSTIKSLTFKANGGWVTPLQADTIFGHVCWQIKRDHDTNKELQAFLKECDENPPFVLSDVFVKGTIPRPRLSEEFCKETLRPEDTKDKASMSRALGDMKRYTKDIPYIKVSDLKRYSGVVALRNKEERELTMQKLIHELVDEYFPNTSPNQKLNSDSNRPKEKGEIKTTINRYTGTTEEAQGPYMLTEYRFTGELWLLLCVLDEKRYEALNKTYALEARIRRVLEEGYGKRKSIGKGFFTITKDWTDDTTIPRIDNPTYSVMLSNYVPATNDPTDGLYETFVKYGKLSEERSIAGGENFYKKPLIMVRHGATFAGTPERVGRMLDTLCEDGDIDDRVRHWGYGFGLSF